MLAKQIESIISGYIDELRKSGLNCFSYTCDGILYIDRFFLPDDKSEYLDFISGLIVIKIMSKEEKRIYTKYNFLDDIEQLENDFEQLISGYYPAQCAIDSLYLLSDTIK